MLSLAGCGSDTSSAKPDPEPKTAEKPKADTDAAIKNRIKSRLDFVGAESYSLGRVEVKDGDVTIYTGIGADDDGEMAAGGVCAEVWGLQGEGAPKGVKSVEIIGRDQYTNDAKLKDC